MAVRALEHPAIERRVPSLVVARSTLALVAVERGRLAAAEATPRRRRRPWAGSARAGAGSARTRPPPSARCWPPKGSLVEAEHELASAERFFRDEVATLHHTWLLVLLARVRLRRGRLAEAEATLRSAREALGELADSGRVPALADEVERELETATRPRAGGEVLEPPSEAELAVLRLLATDLSTREIGERLFLSPNTIRSHTACALPQARGALPRGRGRPRHRARPAGANANHPGERPAIRASTPVGRWHARRHG